MFIYLSKKIAIPKGVKLKSVSWNTEQGWIACGGENGLLKVLKLDSAQSDEKGMQGVAAPSNLSMNQTLEGHNGSVVCVTWNSNYRKLTTSDQYGLIIVWMLHKGMWFEEMINNRNKSVVRDMKWTTKGQKICIVYEDGAVIVGSVDGNRLWGKELNVQLSLVEWSPDGRSILFVTLSGQVLIFDALGNKISSLNMYAKKAKDSATIIGIDWHDDTVGPNDPLAPTLAVAFSNGRVQLTHGHLDDNPVLIATGINLSECKWSSNGTVLALAGTQTAKLPSGEKREVNMVQFYTCYGQHLRTLKVPGSKINALSWEGSGLRIALAVGSYIYFANIRPDYKWTFFANTLVYAFHKQDRHEQCVLFWDTNSDERNTKYVEKLLSISSAGENCVLATGTNDGSGQFALVLCNAIGNPVDSKYIDIEPTRVSMTPYHVIACDDETVYVWQYRTQVAQLTSLNVDDRAMRRRDGRERIFHVDDSVADYTSFAEYMKKSKKRSGVVNDSICTICASKRYLMVARESGTIHRYTLPHISLEDKYVLRCRPQKIALNCDSTKMSCIDINGVLSVLELDSSEGPEGTAGRVLDIERKDSWDLLWSEDNPDLFTVMEKTRMYVIRNLKAEEPILSSGYLCHFKDLQIRAVLLDEILLYPQRPAKGTILDFETKSLRDAQELLHNVGLKDTYDFIESNPHKRLWRLLADASLEQLDLGLADKGFVRCQDYQGVQFVKRLRKLDDKLKQKAEVAAYFQRFDEAEQIYRDMDRKDLAIDLRKRLGDWFRVVQLVQSGAGDDELLQLAWNKIGDYYLARQKYEKAKQYYQQAKNTQLLVRCYFKLEDYGSLEKLIPEIPEESALLTRIGELLQRVGIHQHAVAAYLKAGDVKAAIDCCVLLNQWKMAVELAEKHQFPQIQSLLAKYATHLLENKGPQGRINAIELYRKAQKSVEAANLLTELARDAAKTGHLVRAKKLQVLAALEVEAFRERTLKAASEGNDGDGTGQTTMATAQQTLAGLMTLETAATQAGGTAGGLSSTKAMDNAWHGAEAYHYYILAQKLLYRGNVPLALQCAKELERYEDVLGQRELYSLLAVAAFYNGHFASCSKAFVKLEGHAGLTGPERKAYEALALSIFMRNPPSDPMRGGRDDSAHQNKHKRGRQQRLCIASGKKLYSHNNPMPIKTCRRCRHSAFQKELRSYSFCPLCHGPIANFR